MQPPEAANCGIWRAVQGRSAAEWAETGGCAATCADARPLALLRHPWHGPAEFLFLEGVLKMCRPERRQADRRARRLPVRRPALYCAVRTATAAGACPRAPHPANPRQHGTFPTRARRIADRKCQAVRAAGPPAACHLPFLPFPSPPPPPFRAAAACALQNPL